MDQRRAKTKVRAAETLEFEDEDARQGRLQNILENMNTSSSFMPKDNTILHNFGKQDLPTPEATNELLARVQNFLPQIEASNAALLQEDLSSLDIENVEETDGQYIEMNLGLGVFEDRGKKVIHSDSGSESENEGLSSSSVSSSASSDSDEDTSEMMSLAVSRPMKPLPKRSQPRPSIVELDDRPTTS